MKIIKAFNNAINWVKVETHGNHIHVIGVYLTPSRKEAQQHNLEQLRSILGQLSSSPFGRQQIIIADDFNEALEEASKLVMEFGLSAVVPTGTATHWKEGHLDQIFTNMQSEGQEVSQVNKRLSDHKKITVSIRGEMQKLEFQESGIQRVNTQTWVGQYANKKETVEALLKRNQITAILLREMVTTQPSKQQQRWYRNKQKPTLAKSTEFESVRTSMKKEEWAKTMKHLESLHKLGEWKEFYSKISQLTRIKVGSCLVQAVQQGDWVTTNDEERDEVIAKYMEELYQGEQLQYQQQSQKKTKFFNKEDVKGAIRNSNFSMAIGPDMFDGNTLKSNDTLCQRVSQEIAEMLNAASFPDYFREGRLTALQKAGKTTVDLEDIRPIVIRSHLAKISEKAVLSRLLEKHKHLAKTAQSQTGANRDTANNITKMLMSVHSGRGRRKKTAVLLIDL